MNEKNEWIFDLKIQGLLRKRWTILWYMVHSEVLIAGTADS